MNPDKPQQTRPNVDAAVNPSDIQRRLQEEQEKRQEALKKLQEPAR